MAVKRDVRLLERAQQWDERALEEIYDTFAPRIYRYAYRHLGHRSTAQDVTSETFHRLLDALKNGGGPRTNLSAWLYRVAHNVVVDIYRRQPDDPPASLEDVDLAGSADQEHRAEHNDRVAWARRALDQLTDLQQQVIVLRYLESLSLTETAEVMNKTVNAVKALQHRGVAHLRRLLEEGL
jgi:RNA polymerase sigma-70 factor (ECF subfamily)